MYQSSYKSSRCRVDRSTAALFSSRRPFGNRRHIVTTVYRLVQQAYSQLEPSIVLVIIRMAVVALAPQAATAAAGQPTTDAAATHPLLVIVDEEANYTEDLQTAADNNGCDDRSCCPWLTIVGFIVLTFNSAMAIIVSRGDMTAIAFVVFCYADLVALFVCLRMYERAIAGSSRRWRLKVAVWVLTTLLTLAFSYKVAAVMPPPVAVVVWLMAFGTVAGGFIAFFVYEEKTSDH
ncbi:hypothetical protein BS78_K139100 [Paspalum vaginatum]|uniref:Uncharacterized protein n=1 Tax=Paspalum vaginatum TaxID=158149 RepID=A0A9W7XC62_9POAL|nr:hypothetical protein BS78_K139100 [Paspalum vaginatum]